MDLVGLLAEFYLVGLGQRSRLDETNGHLGTDPDVEREGAPNKAKRKLSKDGDNVAKQAITVDYSAGRRFMNGVGL